MKHARRVVRMPYGVTTMMLEECGCGRERRGSAGGVCLTCSKAIPEVLDAHDRCERAHCEFPNCGCFAYPPTKGA